MNRTGLLVALGAACVVGLVFAVYPRLDIQISRPFFNTGVRMFAVNAQPWVQHTRDTVRLIVALLAAPAFIAIVVKVIWPRRPMLIDARAAIFIVSTLALGPGLVANTLLKDHWGRVRPIDIVELGGDGRFTPWWDPRGDCPNNCSFIAGEPAGAFWTLAPAALAPPQWRLGAYTAALAFGSAVGMLRIAAGGHFFTDVVYAGVIVYLVIWACYGLIYRWRASRDAIASFLRRIGWLAEK